MKLIGNRILAEIIPSENKTKGGIIIPEKINLEKNRGKIVLVGPAVKDYYIGQIVQFDPNTAVYDTVRGTECVFLKEDRDIVLLISN
jgi:co-chaperonin GroES (HSP10)